MIANVYRLAQVGVAVLCLATVNVSAGTISIDQATFAEVDQSSQEVNTEQLRMAAGLAKPAIAGAVEAISASRRNELPTDGGRQGGLLSLTCAQPLIEVSTKDFQLAETACGAAEEANAYFRELGLQISQKVHIRVAEDLCARPGNVIAAFDVETFVIRVSPIHRLKEKSRCYGPFPMVEPPVLFTSVITHELTHAYISQTAGNGFSSLLAHEYLAYALQLDQMPEIERTKILKESSVPETVTFDDFNEAVLNFAPLRFAAMAWAHFEAQGGNQEVVRRVLESPTLFQSLRE